eukprot:SAG22_NODE_949_length_6356_cov_2.100527_6_plen_65_part_00
MEKFRLELYNAKDALAAKQAECDRQAQAAGQQAAEMAALRAELADAKAAAGSSMAGRYGNGPLF